MLHLLLAVFVGAAATDDGWIAVEREVYINYDLENSPLQIKTDSVVGSNEQVLRVYFYGHVQDDTAGGVFLYFSSPPQYYLYFCSTSWTNFPTVLPIETNKVWTITLSRVSGEIRVVITCNTVEVLNVVLSSTTCSDSDWSTYWSRDVEKIYFTSLDTASDYYRAAPDCTRLNTKWTSTIETTTMFPVDPGTVVTVTCSNSDAVNGGSSEVTCTKGTDFTFSIEPSCSDPCSAGTYRSTDQTSCVPCEEGTVSTGTGATSCVSCDLGKQSNSDKTLCVECGTGTFRDSTVTVCTGCPENSITELTGAASCTFCPTGTVSNEERTKCVSCEGLPKSWKNVNTETQFPLPPRSEVSLKCRTGYTLSGDRTVTCQEGRTFSFTNPPVCQLDTCSGFPSELSGLTPDNTFPVFHNKVVSVSCTRDSLLMGDNVITCVKGTDFHFQDKPICKALGKSY
ncbi:hypothetical protein ACHWQZ_G015760 [Mnemiopsis leidyi]